STRWMWPACRLPMVGTTTMRWPSRRKASSVWRKPAMSVMCFIWRYRSVETVFRGREAAILYFAHEGTHRPLDAIVRISQKVLHELGFDRGNPEYVVQDKDLGIGVGTGSDTDHRNRQGFSNRFRQRAGDALQQQ